MDKLEKTHRHYVFSIPKILRTYFRYNRRLLSGLSRCAYETVKEMMRSVMEDNTVVPGMIVAFQTFGSNDIHCRENQQVFYQGKAETYTYQPLDFLAYMSLHIPDKGQCLH